MQNVTEEWLESYENQARPIFRCAVIQNNDPNDVAAELAFSPDSSMQIDASGAVTRSFTATLVDESGDLTPNDANDLLMPFGTEVAVWAGLEEPAMDNGGLLAQGVFRIDSATIGLDEDGLTNIQLDCFDRAYAVQKPVQKTVVIRAGTPVGVAIRTLVQQKLPTAIYVDSADEGQDYRTPNIIVEDDCWAAAQKLAADSGGRLAFDTTGRVRRYDLSAITDVPYYTFSDGENCVVSSYQRAFSAGSVPSAVRVESASTSSSPGAAAIVYDDDPKSPTYYLGPYGVNTMVYRSEFILNAGQCAAAARVRLQRYAGQAETMSVSAPPNYALMDWSVVRLIQPAMGDLNRRYVAERISWPLSAEGKMDLSLRRVLFPSGSGE